MLEYCEVILDNTSGRYVPGELVTWEYQPQGSPLQSKKIVLAQVLDLLAQQGWELAGFYPALGEDQVHTYQARYIFQRRIPGASLEQ